MKMPATALITRAGEVSFRLVTKQKPLKVFQLQLLCLQKRILEGIAQEKNLTWVILHP